MSTMAWMTHGLRYLLLHKCVRYIKKPCRMMIHLTSQLKRITSLSVKVGKDVWNDGVYRSMFMVYFVTFFVILPLLCQSMPNSLFFYQSPDLDSLRKQTWDKNDMNAKAANDYVIGEGRRIRSANGSVGPNGASSKPVVYIAIITVNRMNTAGRRPQYLTQTFAKTHRLLKEFHSKCKCGDFYQMALCNVDAHPEDNAEAKYLSTALGIPIFNRFAHSEIGLGESGNIFEKEKNDYVYCLNAALQKKPGYVLLLEDDALPAENAFHVIHHTLTHSFKHHFSEKQLRETAYIKLYHPTRLLTFFNLERERIPELLALGILFGSISLWILTRWTAVKLTEKIGLHRLWLYTVVYFILFFFCIGRGNLLKVREFSKHFYQIVPAPSCCTPAMLFPNFTAQGLVKYLYHTSARSGYAKDYILETFKKDTHLVGRMISPNLVEHIGMYSTLRKKDLNPYIVN